MQYRHIVRIACPGDQAAIEALLKASYSKLFKDGYDDATLSAVLPIITRANPALLSSDRFFIAENDAIVTGCGGWSTERPGTGEMENGLGHVRHFAVHPDWIRRGIGNAILRRSISEARRHGIVQLECISSLVAVDFYKAAGFRDMGPVSTDVGGGKPFPGRRMLLSIE